MVVDQWLVKHNHRDLLREQDQEVLCVPRMINFDKLKLN